MRLSHNEDVSMTIKPRASTLLLLICGAALLVMSLLNRSLYALIFGLCFLAIGIYILIQSKRQRPLTTQSRPNA
jgi:uncharacterized membrane protein YfcA